MTTQTANSPGPRYLLDKVLAVCLIVWLLFFGGFSTLKQLLTPARLSQVGQIADTIRTGAGRALAPVAAPAAKPGTAPRGGVGAPALPAANTQAQIEAASQAAYQATVQAVERAAGNIASAPVKPIGGLPTAVIAIPTSIPIAQITVVPRSMPVVYAQSGPILPTPQPTMTYPTPLPAAADAYTVSPDGLCVIAPREGTPYQVCQAWKYAPQEAASVADYIRTGRLPGSPVQ